MSTNPSPNRGGVALPQAVLDYVDATNDGRIDDAASCFTSDARAHDDHQDYQGAEAIRQWIAETMERYHAKNHILSAKADGDLYTVISEVSGSFPGSPVELEFQFIVTAGKISSLNIQ